MSKKKVKDEVSVEEEKVTEKVVEKKKSVDSDKEFFVDGKGKAWYIDTKTGRKTKA